MCDGERDHYEVRVPRPYHASDHRHTWIVARGRATERDSDGTIIRVAGTFRDVSVERERDRDRRIAHEVIRSMGEAVCVTGLDYRFTSVNAALSRASPVTPITRSSASRPASSTATSTRSEFYPRSACTP
jgi:PAS domain-containing protein